MRKNLKDLFVDGVEEVKVFGVAREFIKTKKDIGSGNFEILEYFITKDEAIEYLENIAFDYISYDGVSLELVEVIIDEDLEWTEIEETHFGYYSPKVAELIDYDIEYMMTPDSEDKILLRDYDYLDYLFKDKEVKLSELIKKARLIKGFTQKEAAEISGIPQRTYEKYEIGERVPGSVNMLRLKKALDIDQELIDEALENEEKGR